MGLEPILYELMRLVSLPLDYSAIVEPLIGIEPISNVYKTLVLAIKLKRRGAVGGIEPTVLAVKERCLNHLTNGPCVTPILTRKPLCGGECGIRTHGTFLFDSFQDCCINPDSANSPCNSSIKSRTL